MRLGRPKGVERTKVYDSLEVKMEAGIWNETSERIMFIEELLELEEVNFLNFGGSCAVSRAASTEQGFGPCILRQTSSSSLQLKENMWMLRKMEIEGAVKD